MPVPRDRMGQTYDNLLTDWARISQVAFAEEDAFRKTLQSGTQIFDAAADEVKASGGTTLSGERAFALHDTYGFPIDLTLEMAAEQGLVVDEQGFRGLMAEQRERAKADARAKKGAHGDTAVYRGIFPAGVVDQRAGANCGEELLIKTVAQGGWFFHSRPGIGLSSFRCARG